MTTVSEGSGWEVLSHLFAPDTPMLHVRGARPEEAQLRDAGAVLLTDPPDRHPTRLRSLGFGYIRDFALIPNARVPRWLIPIGDGRTSSGAFALHPPFGRASRLKHAVGRVAARSGAPIWYRHTLRLAARETPPVESWTSDVCGTAVQLGFSRGAWGARPKPGLIVLDDKGRALAFGKLARERLRRSGVAREALALATLATDPRTRGMSPSLLADAELAGTRVTLQEPIPGRVGGASLSPSHARFLAALVTDQRPRPVASSAFVRDLRERVSADRAPLLRRLLESLSSVHLPPTTTHGDFAPWNLRIDDAGVLRAFDWEWCCVDGLPLIDELHHELQVSFLVRDRDGRQVAPALDAKASSCPFGLDPARVQGLHALGILGYMLRIAEDGYGDTLLARRYADALGHAVAKAGVAE